MTNASKIKRFFKFPIGRGKTKQHLFPVHRRHGQREFIYRLSTATVEAAESDFLTSIIFTAFL